MKKLVLTLVLCALAGSAYGQGRSIKGVGGFGGDSSSTNVIGDTGSKYNFYVGMDYEFLTLAVLDSAGAGGFPQQHYNGRLYNLRFGYRLFKTVGIEANYGIDAGDEHNANGFGFNHAYGVYVVPTATVLDTVELALKVGYAFTGVKHQAPGQPEYSTSVNSAAFGANLELPIREFSASLPNLRLTGGGMVFIQRSNAQIYGFHVGLRYDFGFGSNETAAPVATSTGAGASEGSAPAGAAPAGGMPGGAPAGAAPAGGMPGGAPAGAAPAGGMPGGAAPAGGMPGGAPAGAAPAGGMPGGAAPAGGAPGGGSPDDAAPSGGAPAPASGGAPPV